MRLMHRAAGTVRRLLHSAVITLILPRKEGFRVLPVIELSLGCSWQGEMTTGRAQDKAYFLCWVRNTISAVMRPAASVSHRTFGDDGGSSAQVGGIDRPCCGTLVYYLVDSRTNQTAGPRWRCHRVS